MRHLFSIFLSVILLWTCSPAYSQNVDIDLLRTINVQRNTALDPTYIFISKTVTPVVIATPLVILTTGLITKNKVLKQKSLFIASTIFTTAAVATILKHSIDRERPFNKYPDIEKVDGGGSPSFPSGHTSDAFGLATSVSLAFPKWYVIAPAYLWASSIGYSRMHLGVHYPSDVLGGMIVGSGCALVCHAVNKYLQKKQNCQNRNYGYRIPIYF